MTISPQDTAKMIRGALKAGFPRTKFSVRYKSYSGGHSIDVRWTDGPAGSQVKPILDRYESKGFDGMTDCSYSCGDRLLAGVKVFVNGGYVHGSRDISPQLRAKVADRLAYECGLGRAEFDRWGSIAGDKVVPFQWHLSWAEKLFTVDDIESGERILASDSTQGEWFSQLVYRVELNVSLEAQRAIPAELLPEYVDLEATVSTGRASWEPLQKMFEGHEGVTQ